MKDNQKSSKPGNGNKNQDADTRNKKTTGNPSTRDAHQNDQDRRSNEKIERKGPDAKGPDAEKKTPGAPGATVNEPANKQNTPWKDPDTTNPEKKKEVYATPDTDEDETATDPRNKQNEVNEPEAETDEYIEEERERTGTTDKIEEGDEQRSDPGTFDPQAGKDAAKDQNKQSGTKDTAL